jgi:hypothetical protein
MARKYDPRRAGVRANRLQILHRPGCGVSGGISQTGGGARADAATAHASESVSAAKPIMVAAASRFTSAPATKMITARRTGRRRGARLTRPSVVSA